MGVSAILSLSFKSPGARRAPWDLPSSLHTWNFLKVRRKPGGEGAVLIQAPSPPSACLPFRVWQTQLHSRPLVDLETMQVYFGTAERA